MNRKAANIQASLLPLLKRHGVRKAALFGSVARGTAKSTSDVDVLVEFTEEKTLFDLVALEQAMQKKLRKPVDIVTYRSLHPLLKNRILQEQKVIYE